MIKQLAQYPKSCAVLALAAVINFIPYDWQGDVEEVVLHDESAEEIDSAPETLATNDLSVHDIQAMILAGIDPTAALEAPAAGGIGYDYADSCRTGTLSSDGESTLDDETYIMAVVDGTKYIQTLGITQTSTLIQSQNQTVTANRVDNLPEEAKQAFEESLNNIQRCKQMDLYLASVTDCCY